MSRCSVCSRLESDIQEEEPRDTATNRVAGSLDAQTALPRIGWVYLLVVETKRYDPAKEVSTLSLPIIGVTRALFRIKPDVGRRVQVRYR